MPAPLVAGRAATNPLGRNFVSTPIMPTTKAARYPHEDNWWHQALCAALPPETMFPPAHDRDGIMFAKEVCARCPVRAECKADAPDEGSGIWAGSGLSTIKWRWADR